MKMIFRVALLLSLVSVLVLAACGKNAPAAPAAPQPTAGAASAVKQVTGAGVTMEWKVSGASIEIMLRAQTTGWVAVGFDPSSLMKGANFVIGYFKDGKAVVADHFGNQLTNHAADTTLGGKDDVSNVSGKEENGVTEIRFTIPLNSGDPNDKPLGPGRHVVLLARGAGDDVEIAHRPDARAKVTIEL